MSNPIESPRAEEAVRRLLSIHRHLRQTAKQVSSELGISGRELSALRFLHEAGPRSVGQIRARLYLADSTTSELLDGLVAKGLVTRARSTSDNRVAMVALEPPGAALVARAPLAGISLLRHRLRSEPQEKVERLGEALEYLAGLVGIEE